MSKTSFCGHCKNIGMPESVYLTHYSRETKSIDSAITCPELLKKVCSICPSKSHTKDKCVIGEKLYAEVAKLDSRNAGKITAMMLEQLSINEINEILNNLNILSTYFVEAVLVLCNDGTYIEEEEIEEDYKPTIWDIQDQKEQDYLDSIERAREEAEIW